MVLIIWEQWKDIVVQQFSALYEKKHLADVEIQVGQKKCYVHSIVITLFSKIFQELVEYAHQEECEHPINITFADLTFEAVETVISFMYLGKMSVEDHLIPEVLYLSKLLKIKGLEKVEEYFKNSISNGEKVEPNSSETFMSLTKVNSPQEASVDIQALLSSKKFSADVIPVSNSFVEEPRGTYDECFSDLESGEEGMTERTNLIRTRKHMKKYQRTLLRKMKKRDQDFQAMDIPAFKEKFLLELQRYQEFNRKDEETPTWPLTLLGFDLLLRINETFCWKLKINKEDEYDIRRTFKTSKNLLQMEMSFLWHTLCNLKEEERRQRVEDLPKDYIKYVFDAIWDRRSIVDIITAHQMSSVELSCCVFLLLMGSCPSCKLITWAYRISDPLPLYRHRIDKAVSLFQTTDHFLMDITDQCWVPYAVVKEEIEKKGIKRVDEFDTAIQKGLLLCSEGIDVDTVVSMANMEQYAEDFVSILEYHMGRDIVLPLSPYEERIQLALKASWDKKVMMMSEAAKEFIVYYPTLCKRALSKEDKESTFTPKLRTKRTKLSYRGKTEPLVSSKANRRGLKSKTDRVIRAALLSCKEGMCPEDAFRLYNIQNPRTKSIIKYNVTRKDAPFDKSYTTRFKNAVDDMTLRKMTINQAAKLHMINYSALREWFHGKNRKRVTRTTSKNRKKPRFEDQIEAAIRSVKAGMTVEEAFKIHGMKDRKNLNILKHNAERPDPPLYISYETRLNMAIKAVRNREMSCTDAGKEYCVNSSTLRYYELDGLKVPSKGLPNFEDQIKGAFTACKEGMTLTEACEKFNIRTPKYQKILEYNLTRVNPPLNVPYEVRMKKAKESVSASKMSISEAADVYMVSPAVLTRFFKSAGIASTMEKNSSSYVSIPNKFDTRMIAAIKCCRRGMNVGKSFQENRLCGEKSLECLKFNAHRLDAPISVPYPERVKRAIRSVLGMKMTVITASKQFIVNPFTLDKACRSERRRSGMLRDSQKLNCSEGRSDNTTITVIPIQGASQNKAMVPIIKEEKEEVCSVELYMTYGTPDVNEEEKEVATALGPRDLSALSKTDDDKGITIQILKRYSKTCPSDTAISHTKDNIYNNIGTADKTIKSEHEDFFEGNMSSNTIKRRSPGEKRSGTPMTAYEQRLQLALEACLTSTMTKLEATRRYQVNLRHLNDKYEAENSNWRNVLCCVKEEKP